MYLFILLIAATLRGQAFMVNTRPYGDVSLMSLAAKQYLLTSIIQYPSPNSLFPHTLNDPLATPAYMHGAAYPFLGGLLAKLIGTQDTFFSLKLINFAAGMLLVALTISFCRKHISHSVAWIAGLWVATSPVLIDFSANGSPYILGALALSVLTTIFARWDFHRSWHYGTVGAVCALAFQIHPSMLVLTVVTIGFGFLTFRKVTLRGTIFFITAWLLCYLPSLVWYLTYFQRPFVSQQIFYLTSALAITSDQREVIRENPRLLLTMPYLQVYIDTMVNRSRVFFDNLTFEVGLPMLLLSASSGVLLLFTSFRTLVGQVMLPRLGYFAATAAGLALLHMRFLVPVVPAILVIAAVGLSLLIEKRTWRPLIGTIAVIYASWSVWSYFTLDLPITRYYRNDTIENAEIDGSADIGRQMIGLNNGTIAGCHNLSLIAYIADMRIYDFTCPVTANKIERLLNRPRFNVRYILLQKSDLTELGAFFEEAAVVAENDLLIVFELQIERSTP